MAEDSTRQGNMETACRGIRPTTGHNGCLMNDADDDDDDDDEKHSFSLK